jgi:hypothetical protein
LKKSLNQIECVCVMFRDIPENVPYIQMRALGTLAGSFVVPLAYLTIRDAGHSKIAAILAALAICFGKLKNKVIQKHVFFITFSNL